MFNGNKIYKITKCGVKKEVYGFIPGLSIRFKGKNSTVELYEPLPKFSKCKIRIASNTTVSINSSIYEIKKMQILGDSNQKFIIGKNFSSLGCDLIATSEDDLNITIGDFCMFAKNIILRATDGHTILENNTNKIINYGKNIKIGNNVWIAGNSCVLKGVNIADNCVVGHGSVVTKDCQPNSVYAGNPAKLVKSNVTWLRESPCNRICEK